MGNLWCPSVSAVTPAITCMSWTWLWLAFRSFVRMAHAITAFRFLAPGFREFKYSVTPPAKSIWAASRSLDRSLSSTRLILTGGCTRLFFSPDPRIEKLNLWPVSDVKFALGTDGAVYAGQQTNTKVTKFGPEGNRLLEIGEQPPCYQEPVALPHPLPDQQEMNRLLARFTRLDNLMVFHGDRIALSYRFAGAAHWGLQLYGSDGKSASQTLEFKLRPSVTDQKRMLYCRAMPPLEGHDLELEVYKLA